MEKARGEGLDREMEELKQVYSELIRERGFDQEISLEELEKRIEQLQVEVH